MPGEGQSRAYRQGGKRYEPGNRFIEPGALLAAGRFIAACPRVGVLRGQTPAHLPVVTLEEARVRAAAVDPTAVAARREVGTASWERRAARLNLLTPSVTVGTSFAHFSEPFFNFGTGGISSEATSATVDARYTLLGSGKNGGTQARRSIAGQC